MTKFSTTLLCAILLCVATLILGQRPRRKAPTNQEKPSLTYNQLIGSGYDLLKEGKIGEAYLAAMEAAQKDPTRFEAYALAALALHVKGAEREAKTFIDKALSHAPPDKKPLLNDLAGKIADALTTPVRSAPTNPETRPLQSARTPREPAGSAPTDPEMRRKLDALRLIVEDADKSTDAESRRKFLQEFLAKSEPFVTQYPGQTEIWVLRAAAAIEMDEAITGWQAGRKLLALGQDGGSDPKIQRLIAMLDRKGWLGEKPPAVIGALVEEFNSKVEAMGTQKFQGPVCSTCKRQESTENSLGFLSGGCSDGFDIEKKHTHRSDDGVSFETVNYTLLVTDSDFHARVFRQDNSTFPGQAGSWQLLAAPNFIRTWHRHDTYKDDDGQIKNKDSEVKAEGRQAGNFGYFFTFDANSSDELQSLADTLMKIHKTCLVLNYR
jgi:hypothetical protein